MKKIITILMMAIIFSSGLWAQAEKTLVKLVKLDGYTALATVLSGDVSVSEWDKDFIRVTTHVELENSNNVILERLVSVGRYEFEVKEEAGEMVIHMPKIVKPVNLKGNLLIEKFSYEINVPRKTSVRTEQPVLEGI